MTGVRAELRKLLSLPSAWVGLVSGLLAAPLLLLLNAGTVRAELTAGGSDPTDLLLQNLGIGLIGAMILGVVVMSSEYTASGTDEPGARQLTATLTATPGRVRLLTAKAAVLVLIVTAQGMLTTLATVLVSRLVHGDALPLPSPGRLTGALLFWVLSALLAFALTIVTRRGIIPLILLIVNSTVVSVSYLLTKIIPAAAYLPDIVGAHMFLRGIDAPVDIGPVTAGLTMAAWVAVLLTGAAAIFVRRDA